MEMKLSSFFGKFGAQAGAADTIMENQSPADASASSAKAVTGRAASERLRQQGMVLGALVLVIAGLLIYQTRSASRATGQVEGAGQLRTLSQEIAKSAQLTLQGNSTAFAELKTSRTQFGTILADLAASGDASDQVDALSNAWAKTDKDAGQLI